MDCEKPLDAPRPEDGLWGPADDEQAGLAIAAFDQTLAQAGLVGTYFAVPDLATRHAPLLQQLRRRGSEVGLHVHAQGLGPDRRWKQFLGACTPQAHRTILTEALAQWTLDMGHAPEVYRPGNFSGNPRMLKQLPPLGLLAGSVSLPGRFNPAYAADWSETPPTAYLAPAEQGLPAFLDIPVTADVSRNTDGEPAHLRIEITDPGEIESIVHAALQQSRDENIPPTVTVMTHNNVPYHEQTWRDTLQRWIDELFRILKPCAQNLHAVTIHEFRKRLLPAIPSSQK